MTDPVMLLSQLHGEGRVTFRALRAAGFFTLAAVAEATVQTLADRAHLSLRSARRLKTGAEELIGTGIGLETDEPDGNGAARKNRRTAARAEFSEGVSLDEAMLLGQGQTALVVVAEEPPVPQDTESIRMAEAQVATRIAAAAEAASALTRPPEPQPRRTFWAFG